MAPLSTPLPTPSIDLTPQTPWPWPCPSAPWGGSVPGTIYGAEHGVKTRAPESGWGEVPRRFGGIWPHRPPMWTVPCVIDAFRHGGAGPPALSVAGSDSGSATSNRTNCAGCTDARATPSSLRPSQATCFRADPSPRLRGRFLDPPRPPQTLWSWRPTRTQGDPTRRDFGRRFTRPDCRAHMGCRAAKHWTFGESAKAAHIPAKSTANGGLQAAHAPAEVRVAQPALIESSSRFLAGHPETHEVRRLRGVGAPRRTGGIGRALCVGGGAACATGCWRCRLSEGE